LVEEWNSAQEKWLDFLTQADLKISKAEAVQGFLLAVQDCCLTKGVDAGVPNFILTELTKRITSVSKP
jgi:hypothetical protein